MGSFSGIMALANEVTDLLTVHHEVNTICSEDQEAVICMLQLQKHTICTTMEQALQGKLTALIYTTLCCKEPFQEMLWAFLLCLQGLT